MSFTIRLLETLFRHKLLVFFPIFVIPLIVTPLATLMTPIYYETWTSLWIQNPTYLNVNLGGSAWQTPAQTQGSHIQELLKTRAFLGDVARRTALAPLVGTPQGEERLQSYIQSNMALYANGTNLISIRMRGDTPQLAQQLANAVVDAYRERTSASQLDQTELAVSFYESQYMQAQQQLTEATEGLRRYIVANPRLSAAANDPNNVASSGANAGAIAALDPQYGQLQQAVEVANKNLTTSRDALDRARLQTAAALEGSNISLQVLDPAQVPTTAYRDAKKRGIMAMGASLAGGAAISTLLLAFLMASDRSVRSEADLSKAAGGRVLGVIPKMDIRHTRATRKEGPDLTRRAIGFVAGAALPPPLLGNAQ